MSIADTPSTIPAAAEIAGALLGAAVVLLVVEAELGGVAVAAGPASPGAFLAPVGAIVGTATGAVPLRGASAGNKVPSGAITGTPAARGGPAAICALDSGFSPGGNASSSVCRSARPPPAAASENVAVRRFICCYRKSLCGVGTR
jgi:hypothetical protein